MAVDWSNLGTAIAGNETDLSFAKGQQMGAQTQNAMAEAEARVAKNRAQLQLSDSLKGIPGMDPKLADASATALTAGASLGDVVSMMLKSQEHGFRATAADPNTSFDVGNRALMGVSSAPVDPLQKVGNGYINRFDTEAGVTALPANAQDSTSASAAMQALKAFGFLGPDGRVIPGKEAQAFDLMRTTQRVIDEGGVPSVIDANPFSGLPGPRGPSGAPPAPAAAPSPIPGLDAALPPPMPVPAAPAAPAAAPSIGAPYVPPGAPGRSSSPVASLGQVAGNAATIEAAKVGARNAAEKAGNLPSTLAALDKLEVLTNNLLAAPGFDSAYGNWQGPASGFTKFASQDVSNVVAMRDQLKGATFLAAIPGMKGYGQLSNAEGMKVQDAYTLLTTPGISETVARKAAADLITGLQNYRRVAQIEAAVPGAQAMPITRPQGAAPAAGGQLAPTNAQGWQLMQDASGNTAYVGPNGEIEEVR